MDLPLKSLTKKCRFYLKASRADDKVNKRAIELAALALMDHEHLGFWPSTVAAAIVILASLEDDPCQRVIKVRKNINLTGCPYCFLWCSFRLSFLMALQTHVRTKDDDLPKCIEVSKLILLCAL